MRNHFVVVLGAAHLFLGAGSAWAQTCPADAGQPCDSPVDVDLCTDGIVVCNGTVASCRGEGARIWLPADEGSGGFLVNAADAPRQADAAVGPAITWAPGDVGLAVAFDAALSTSWVRIPLVEAQSQLAYTWSFKVFPTQATGTIISRTTQDQFDGFRYEVDGTVTLEGVTYTSPPLPVGQWRAVTIAVSDSQLTVWHDGGLVATHTLTATASTWVSDIWFGQDQDSNNGGFQTADAFAGLIDDIVYYPRTLTSGQITDLFAFGVPFQQTHRELCDGIDNDCNPATPDVKDTVCDGPDNDLCENGFTQCTGGLLGLTSTCGTETVVDIVETCNLLDDDCDGVTDNGTGAGGMCDGPDPDACDGGRITCTTIGGTTCGSEPVLFYDFESDAVGARTAFDATSWNHEGAFFAGATYDPAGHTGRAAEFDGSANGLVRIHASPALRVGEWAFATWVRPSTDVQGALLYQRNVFAVWRNADGSLSVSRGAAPTGTETSIGSVPKDVWTHVAVSVDNGTATIFVNGASVGTAALGNLPPFSQLQYPVSLGCISDDRTCLSAAFEGRLDDVYLFNRPLNVVEVSSIVDQGSAWFVAAREQCGVTDGDCDGSTANTAAGCTLYYRDGDDDGYGADTIGGLRPTLWWSMDAVNADGSIADWSRHEVKLQRLGGARRVVGQVGLALEFDGQDRTGVVETAPVVNSWTTFSSELTFAAWINPHAKGSGSAKRTIVSAFANVWSVVIGSSGRLQFQAGGTTINGPSLPLNSWQHVAVTVKGTSVRIFRNGTLTDTGTLASTITAQHGLGLGNAPGVGGQPYDGLIDEVVLFSRELGNSEIGLVYSAADHACLCAPNATFDVTQPGDCADGAPGQHPGAAEICDGNDTDCNGTPDDIVSSACTPSSPKSGCSEGLTACNGTNTVCVERPESYFSFDEGTGRIAYDRVQAGRSMGTNATVANLWAPGVTGTAVRLEKDNRLFTGKYDFGTGGAVAFHWAPKRPLLDTGRTLVALGATRDLTTGAAITMGLRTDGFDVSVQGLPSISEPYNEWVADGQWHHVVLSWKENGSSDQLSLWIDGRRVQTVIVDLGAISYINLGSSPNESVGLIDNVVVYERAIPTAIARHLNSVGPTNDQLNREWCDGADNDCDGATDEDESGWGVGATALGDACETQDADLCTEGTWRCADSQRSAECVDGPVGYWNFDNPDTTFALDLGGDAGDLTNLGPKTNGRSGQGVALPVFATPMAVQIPSAVSLSQGTASIWIRPGANTSFHRLFRLARSGQWELTLEYRQNSGQSFIRVGGDPLAALSGTERTHSTTGPGSNWQHLVLTWNRADDQITVAIDGTVTAVYGGLEWPVDTSVDSVTSGTGGITNGVILADDLALYARALSATDIADLSGNSAPSDLSAELCDAVDNDCDGSTDEGYSLGASCDSPADADLCDEGGVVCQDLYTGGCNGDGPVMALLMDDVADGEVLDHSGADLHGVVHGTVASVAGKFGQARSFSGGHIAVPSYGRLALAGGAQTLALWVRPADGNSGVLLHKPGHFGVMRRSDGSVAHFNDAAATDFPSSGAGFVAADNWSHVAVVWDGTTRTTYVNGTAVGTTPYAGTMGGGEAPVRLGCKAGSSGSCVAEWFAGALDEALIYDYALTSVEIASLVSDGLPALSKNAPFCSQTNDHDCDGTIATSAPSLNCTMYYADTDGDGFGVNLGVKHAADAYFGFDSVDGTSVPDESGNANDLTRVDTPVSRTGMRGYALWLDSDYSQPLGGTSTVLSQASELTIGFWFNARGATAGRLFGSPSSIEVSYSGGAVRVDGYGQSATGSGLSLDTWYYVHYSVDGPNDTGSLKVYNADGSLKSNSNLLGSLIPAQTPATNWFSIGSEGGAASASVLIDDIGIWRSIQPPHFATETGAFCGCAPTGGFTVTNDDDCNDTLGTIKPTADELCDGVDQNCNGVTDESSVDCDDSLSCTTDVCVAGSCANTVNPGTCLTADGCFAGGDLNPSNDCERCEPTTTSVAWTARPDGSSCNDGDACTESDQCAAGTCGGSTVDCDDSNECTDDTCDSATGCVNAVDAGKVVACYSGTVGTSGTGECKDGTATCSAAGTLGTCTGEVTPSTELCDGLDNNCDGATDEPFGVGNACDGNDVGACADGTVVCDGQFSSRCVGDGEATRLGFETAIAGTATPNLGWAGENAFLQSGAAFGTGPTGYGQAAVLDGANDFVQWADPTDLNGTHGGFSVSMWLDRQNTGSLQSLVRHVNSSGDVEFAVNIVHDELQFIDAAETVPSGLFLKPGLGWSHVAVVVDGTAVRFYLDGLLMSAATRTSTSLTITGNKDWRFSSRPNGAYTAIAGGMDEIRLTASAWTAGEVVAQTVVGGEICDGTDNNCDGSTDEFFVTTTAACDGPDVGQCQDGTETACVGPGHTNACLGDGPEHFYALDSQREGQFLGGNGKRWLHGGGATLVTGQRGMAAAFDGSWPATLPRSPSESRSVEGTFAAWVRFDAGDAGRVFEWSNDDGTLVISIGRSSGDLSVKTSGGGQVFAGASMPNGTWMHIAVVADGGTVTAYLNGVMVGSYADAALGTVYSLSGFRAVGGAVGSAGVTADFTGAVDDLLLLEPTAYTQTEIANLVTLGDACNGVDDDCDGTTDEGFELAGTACSGGTTCVDSGTYVCNASQTELECSGTFKPAGDTCDDGDICTFDDSCDGSGGCTGTAYMCDDTLTCTTDTCNGDGTCDFALQPGFCLIAGACVADGTVNAANGCEICDAGTSTSAWSPRPDGTACDDSTVCTTGDTCTAGVCDGTAIDCEDGDDCTVNGCDPTGGCYVVSSALDGTACDDGLPCTLHTECTAGTCAGGVLDDCDDGNPCTVDQCNPALGCVNTVAPYTEVCYDGAAGTEGVGECTGGTRSCVGATLGACVGQVLPSAEVCDGLDNDCNGAPDDTFPTLGSDCDGPDADSCANGTVVCSADQTTTECQNDVQQPEVCDGKDNDCDGSTDEDFVGLGQPCDGADSDQCAAGVLACDDSGGTTCVGDGPVVLLMGEEPEPVSYMARDMSGNGNDALRFGELQTATGSIGNAYAFDGVDDRLQVPASASTTVTDTFTLAVMFKLDAGSGAVSLVESAAGDCIDLGLRINASGGAFALIEQSKCGFTSIAAGTTISYGSWHHLAVTADGTNFKLYLDGVLRNTVPQPGAVYEFGALDIGRHASGTDQPFKGQMDEIGLWTVALSAVEISNLASTGIASQAIDVEICNGLDDDCSGVADDHASIELCDGIDNDCDGTVDNGITVGVACDDGDADLCSDGETACPTWGSGPVSCYGDGPALWYRFETGSGTTAYDYAGTGHATLVGASWEVGSIGGGLGVAPAGTTTLTGYAGASTQTGESTIEARVSYSAGDGPLVRHDGGLAIAVASGALECRFDGGGPSGTELVASWSGLPTNTWVHVGCVYDRGALKLYADGVLQALTHGVGTSTAGTGQFVLGGGATGALDEVVLYDAALTAATVAFHAANGVPLAQIRREICDGGDNDCDATTDEGFEQVGDACDVDGDGCANGAYACDTGPGTMSCQNDTPANGVDLCDGTDDNCDGVTDEDFPELGMPCDGPDADQCTNGTYVCAGDKLGTICQGDTPQVEICNGIDDDCDGDTDEGFDIGQTCDGGDDDQCTDGVWACRADFSGRYCKSDGAFALYPMLEGSGATVASSTGDVPTGGLQGTYSWEADPAGVLRLAPSSTILFHPSVAAGTMSGAFGIRAKLSASSDATLFTATSRSIQIAGDKPRCVVQGLNPATCTGAALDWVSEFHDVVCVFNAGTLSLYVDGALETSCPGTGMPAAAGATVQVGAITSTSDVLVDWFAVWDSAIDATTVATLTLADICDGVDNDCDGITDPSFSTKGSACDGTDIDVCTDGTLTCTADGLDLECTGEVDSPDICNGVDDDCDGDTDEDFPTKGNFCDTADPDDCENGTLTCTADGSGVECTGDITQAEICDGKDNDCNGITDDNVTLGAACDGPDSDLCTDGVEWCDPSGSVACDEVGALIYTQLDDAAGSTLPTDSSRFQRPFESAGSGTVTFGEAGKRATAVSFNGAGFRADRIAELDGLSAVTVAAWVKPNALSGSRGVLSQVGLGGNQLSLRVSNTRVSFTADGTSVHCEFGQGCLDRATAGEWTHVAVVFDAGVVSFYMDGHLAGQRVSSSTDLGTSLGLQRLYIGRGLNSTEWFDGTLDDVVLLPRALSRTEIEAMALTGPGADAVELCDNVDNDCDGTTDEGYALGTTCDGSDPDQCTLGTTVCGASGDEAQCADGGMLLHYDMDDAQSVRLVDRGSERRDLFLEGDVTSTAGVTGNGWTFKGSGSRAVGPPGDFLGGKNGVTFAVWMRPANLSPSSTTLRAVASQYRNGSGGVGRTWALMQSKDGIALRIRAVNDNSTTPQTALCSSDTSCGAVLTAGTWTHVVVAFDAGWARFYADGALLDSFPLASGTTLKSAMPNEPLMLGAAFDQLDGFLGTLDDFRVFDSALSATEVAVLYHQSQGNHLDLCDGTDDDCDGQTDEDDALKGLPCDGPDADLCENGIWACRADGFGLECPSETSTNVVEICNAIDDDCDGQTDEDFPGVGDPCDGDDADLCKEGIQACSPTGGSLICLNEGPSGLWRFDEGSGTVGGDTASTVPFNNLVLNNVFYATGKFGTALEFLGAGGSARATLGIGGQRTLMMWLQIGADGTIYGESETAAQVHFIGRWVAGAFIHQQTDGATTRTLSTSIAQDQWHHVAIVMDPGKTNGLRLYVDCVEASSSPLDTNVSVGEFNLGRAKGVPGLFTGLADELAVFPYVVPESKLCTYATTGIPVLEENRELCDAADNDCDGDTDEGLTGVPAAVCDGADSDLCENGTWTCRSDRLDVECVNETVEDIAETCNELDDDCDGTTDEDFQFEGIDKGFPCDPPGACGPGVVECVSVSAAGCSTGPGGSVDVSSPEFCDDVDNDCDGLTDEKPDGSPVTENCYTGPAGTLGVGECKLGQRECTNGAFGACLGEVVPAPSDTTCDLVDEDCDGVFDEDYDDGVACTVSVCVGGVASNIPDDSLCNDNNPCTDDVCTPTGCVFTIDNTNVPDAALYGKECQVASCQSGNLVFGPDDTATGDDGLSCTSDGCLNGIPQHVVLDGTCLIGNTCYVKGDSNPSGGCDVCMPQFSKTEWSDSAHAADFDEGVGGTDENYVEQELAGGSVSWSLSQVRALSGAYSLYFGNPASNSYDSLTRAAASMTSTPISLVADVHYQLSWYNWMETEGYTGSDKFDTLTVDVIETATGTVTEVWNSLDAFGNQTDGLWKEATVDLTPWSGQEVEIRWTFDSGDAFFNDFEGVYIDQIRVKTGCCFFNGDCVDAGPCEAGFCSADSKMCTYSKIAGCGDCVPQQSTVVFAIDRSISMQGTGATGDSLLTMVKAALSDLMPTYESRINLGVKLFPNPAPSDGCAVTPGLDLDFHSTGGQLNTLLAGVTPDGQTALGAALAEINNAFDQPAVQAEAGNKFVVVITDGAEQCGGNPAVQLAALGGKGIRHMVVGFDKFTDPADLTALAMQEGGLPTPRTDPTDPVYIQAGDTPASVKAAIARALDTALGEMCNGIDDDCDGDTDNAAPDIACNLECELGAGGKNVCENGAYKGCDEAPLPGELCNGEDDDCDGAVDEDFPLKDSPCSIGIGACFTTGVYECHPLQDDVLCNAVAPSGTPETCNGIDDDCDGQTDEDLVQACSTACGTGTEICQAGVWVNCSAIQPVDETCNGLDDNCNGITDDVVPQPCTGACGSGFQQCVGGVIVGCSADGMPEVCNGIDDDCDSLTDEDDNGLVLTESCTPPLPPGYTQVFGDCAIGTRTCGEVLGAPGTYGYGAPGAGGLVTLNSCVPQAVPQTESCNAIDDDCDGSIDNISGTSAPIVDDCYSGPAGTEGVGECKKGTLTCLPGGTNSGICENEVVPAVEICNGLDDDCDGLTDEDPAIICLETNPECAVGACLCAPNQDGDFVCYQD